MIVESGKEYFERVNKKDAAKVQAEAKKKAAEARKKKKEEDAKQEGYMAPSMSTRK